MIGLNQALTEAIRAGIEQSRTPVPVTVSVGFACSTKGDLDEAMHEAYMYLLQAKRSGRNRVHSAATPVESPPPKPLFNSA